MEWRVQFLADNQPTLIVKTIVATLIKTGFESPHQTLWSPEMIAVPEIDLVHPLTDGAIAVNNLESARRQSWSRFWQDPLAARHSRAHRGARTIDGAICRRPGRT